MKKVLLASTVLAMSATVAAAEVTISGSARMGITDTNAAGDAGKAQFNHRVRVSFAMSGETDSGLAFGASMRADQASDANAGGNAGVVFISGAFGKLSMGDVAGGDKAMTGQIPGVDFFAGGSYNEVSYVSDGAIGGFVLGSRLDGTGTDLQSSSAVATAIAANPAVLPLLTSSTDVGEAAKVNYTYSMDALSFSVSHSQNGTDKSSGVGIKYAADNFSIAVGYGSATAKQALAANVFGLSDGTGAGATLFAAGTYNLKVNQMTVAGSYNFGAATINAIVQNTDVKLGTKKIQDVDTIGVAVSGSQGAMGFGIYAKQDTVKSTNTILNDKVTLSSYGIGGTYDLGGGAVASLSFESRENAGGITLAQSANNVAATATRGAKTRDTVAELGLTFSF